MFEFSLLEFFSAFIDQFANVLLLWGWLFILFLALWLAWMIYLLIKRIDYVSAIEWTFLQITLPPDSPQTPKAMEQAFEIWGGIHKSPDIVEMFIEGYTFAWYSCEIVCTLNEVRYIMVVPTAHRKFFEGVIYGQYPTASITEVSDYTRNFPWQDLEKNFDMFGAHIELANKDYYPIRTYLAYADALAEDDKYIDPHQALIDAFTTVNPGEHFWVQILIRPMDAKLVTKWAAKGQEKIAELSGQKKEEKPGVFEQFFGFLAAIPREMLAAATGGPVEVSSAEEKKREIKFPNAAEDAEMKGILQKVSRTAFKTKIRALYISPAGKFHKANQSKLIGVFKQFNTFNLNSLKPVDKTSNPNYFLKKRRRYLLKRQILLQYAGRDFWGDNSGQWFTAEELATLYHFPAKYTRSPSVVRATAGLGSAPDNLPYT